MIIKLHYAELGLTGDIPVIEFKEISDICDFIDFIENQFKASELPFEGFKKIFLLTDGSEIFITENYHMLIDFFRYELFALFEELDLNNVHLFENGSYMEAYDLALMIKENENLSESLQNGVVGQKIG
jgi:hypothetical protein